MDLQEWKKEWVGKRIFINDPGNKFDKHHGVIESILLNELNMPTWARVKLDGIELNYRDSFFRAETIQSESSIEDNSR